MTLIQSGFTGYIKYRIASNKNFIAGVVGQTGSGKSYSALRLAEQLDPDFDIRQVCFSGEDFIELVQGNRKKLHTGSVIVWDELQLSMSHLDFQSYQAKVLSYVLSSFRNKNYILFVTAPYFSMINASVRKLFHCVIETQGINMRQKFVKLKPLLLQTNQYSGDVYRKYLRVYEKNTVSAITNIKAGLPSPKLIKDYERKKAMFLDDTYATISRDLSIKNAKNRQRRELTDYQQSIKELLDDGLTVEEVAEQKGVSLNTIYVIIREIKKKGVEITTNRGGRPNFKAKKQILTIKPMEIPV